MEIVVRARCRPEQAVDFATRILPGVLTGKEPDPYGLHRAVMARVAHALFGLIHQNFGLKSLGAGGIDGIWKPLAPYTLRKRREAELHEAYLEKYKNKPADKAARIAAAQAKAVARRSPTPSNTKILHDSGDLERSLMPGAMGGSGLASAYQPTAGQVADVEPGKGTFGTSLWYADKHHVGQGVTTDLQKSMLEYVRMLFPEPLPEEWVEKLTEVYAQAVAECVPDAFFQWLRLTGRAA